MVRTAVPRATLGRLPGYLAYLRSPAAGSGQISAAAIARALELGEVQVRKDLNLISGAGRPKVGYEKDALIHDIELALRPSGGSRAVIAGAGKLGAALLGFDGFRDYGITIEAAFEKDGGDWESVAGKPIYPMRELRHYCQVHDIRLGIITVPREAAQTVCDEMVSSGIEAIWNFAPISLQVPERVKLRQENLALSLAYLNMSMENSYQNPAMGTCR